MVIKLGYDHNDVKEAEEMIKKQNGDILALMKQLNLPTIEDPQTKEVGELEKFKENMFNIIVEQKM